MGSSSTSTANATVLDAELASYKTIQEDLKKFTITRQKLYQSLNEMGMVKEELEKVKDGDNVYKSVGPLLMSVNKDDAVRNIESRLSLIEKQMTEVQSRLEKKQKEMDDLGTKIVEMQQEVAKKTKIEAENAIETSA